MAREVRWASSFELELGVCGVMLPIQVVEQLQFCTTRAVVTIHVDGDVDYR
jgi:hypothetical protein